VALKEAESLISANCYAFSITVAYSAHSETLSQASDGETCSKASGSPSEGTTKPDGQISYSF